MCFLFSYRYHSPFHAVLCIVLRPPDLYSLLTALKTGQPFCSKSITSCKSFSLIRNTLDYYQSLYFVFSFFILFLIFSTQAEIFNWIAWLETIDYVWYCFAQFSNSHAFKTDHSVYFLIFPNSDMQCKFAKRLLDLRIQSTGFPPKGVRTLMPKIWNRLVLLLLSTHRYKSTFFSMYNYTHDCF